MPGVRNDYVCQDVRSSSDIPSGLEKNIINTGLQWVILYGILFVFIVMAQTWSQQRALQILDQPQRTHCGYVVTRFKSNYCVVQLIEDDVVSIGWNKVFVGMPTCKLHLYDYVCLSHFKHNNSKFWNKFGIFMQANVIYDGLSYKNKYIFQEETITSFYFTILTKLNSYKRNLYYKLAMITDPDIVGLMLGVLFGDGRFISDKLASIFKKTGLMHILVVSGYNISVFVMLVDLFLQQKQGISKKAYVLINFILVSCLIIFVGPSPPVLRAFSFWLISTFFRFIGIRLNNIAKFFYTAVYMFLIINPFWIYNISAILSFVASFGVIFIAPIVEKYIRATYLKSVVPETVSAMLCTTPVLFITFGYIPNLKVFVGNILILPFIDIITFTGYLLLPLLFLGTFGSIVFMWVVGLQFSLLLGVTFFINNVLKI